VPTCSGPAPMTPAQGIRRPAASPLPSPLSPRINSQDPGSLQFVRGCSVRVLGCRFHERARSETTSTANGRVKPTPSPWVDMLYYRSQQSFRTNPAPAGHLVGEPGGPAQVREWLWPGRIILMGDISGLLSPTSAGLLRSHCSFTSHSHRRAAVKTSPVDGGAQGSHRLQTPGGLHLGGRLAQGTYR
jgi:hypothetical protein